MSIVLVLGVGTPDPSAVAFDCDSRQPVAQLKLPNEGARRTPLGAGNGLTQRSVLASAVTRRLGLAPSLPGTGVPAALGAALLVTNGVGALSLAQGIASIPHDRVTISLAS